VTGIRYLLRGVLSAQPSSVVEGATQPGRQTVRRVGRVISDAAARRVGDEFVPPWEATALQDVALTRPLNFLFRALRIAVRARVAGVIPGYVLRPGATVAIVNWNSVDLLEDVLVAVDRFSPPGTEVLIIDNGSTDGSRHTLRSLRKRGRRVLRLRTNLYHGPAMDLAFLLARTEYVVALDVDAFPISSDWLDQLLTPLTCGFTVSGAEAQRGYVHPCCLAMRIDHFAGRKHTFTPHIGTWDPERLGLDEWDTGESITRRERLDHAVLFPRTSVRGPLQLGSVFGGFVYHNGASTRLRADTHIDGLVRSDAEEAWAEAVEKYLDADQK
jgi:Glycosyl transferase family 2